MGTHLVRRADLPDVLEGEHLRVPSVGVGHPPEDLLGLGGRPPRDRDLQHRQAMQELRSNHRGLAEGRYAAAGAQRAEGEEESRRE